MLYLLHGQESLRRNGVALIANKRVRNDLCLFPGQTIQYHSNIQVCAPTSNAEEGEVEWFYENLQDFLELTPQNTSFSS